MDHYVSQKLGPAARAHGGVGKQMPPASSLSLGDDAAFQQKRIGGGRGRAKRLNGVYLLASAAFIHKTRNAIYCARIPLSDRSAGAAAYEVVDL